MSLVAEASGFRTIAPYGGTSRGLAKTGESPGAAHLFPTGPASIVLRTLKEGFIPTGTFFLSALVGLLPVRFRHKDPSPASSNNMRKWLSRRIRTYVLKA